MPVRGISCSPHKIDPDPDQHPYLSAQHRLMQNESELVTPAAGCWTFIIEVMAGNAIFVGPALAESFDPAG
jgi:hypothetical protein